MAANNTDDVTNNTDGAANNPGDTANNTDDDTTFHIIKKYDVQSTYRHMGIKDILHEELNILALAKVQIVVRELHCLSRGRRVTHYLVFPAGWLRPGAYYTFPNTKKMRLFTGADKVLLSMKLQGPIPHHPQYKNFIMEVDIIINLITYPPATRFVSYFGNVTVPPIIIPDE